MKKSNLLIFLLLYVLFVDNSYAATPLLGSKSLESNALKLDCSGFTSSAATEMMIATSPYNWTAASGSQWNSSNCFAQNVTSSAYIGKTVRFGAAGVSGSANTPTLNLSERTGYSTKLRIVLTAGSNKTGSLSVKLDGIITLGNISLTGTGNYDYVYEFDITSLATSTSFINFEQGVGDGNGFVYIREISIFREPKTYLKLNCQMFNANSSTVASVATAPNNWSVSLGANPASTAYCYANNAINTSYGAGIRMGATAVANSGTFTTLNYDLSPSLLYKIKFYIEILVVNSATTGKLDLKVDNGASVWTYNPTTDNGSNGAVANNTWIPFEVEITSGSASSNITLYQTRTTETGSFYIRNLRIYKEYPGAPTNVSAVAGNAKASVSFTVPEIAGGSSITGYVVKSYPDGLTSSGSVSPLVINGLSNGTNYTFTVKALNSGGEGVESNQSNTVVPHSTNNIISVNGSVTLSTLALSPVSDINVSSGSELIINSATTINSITGSPGAKLTLNNGVLLSALNGVNLQSNNDGTATFVDTNNSSLLALTATVHQYLTSGRNWYLSIPVSASPVSSLSTSSSVVRYYEPTASWYTQTIDSVLVPMKGYISANTNAAGTITFTGTLNTGPKSIVLTRTGGVAKTGFNLVGNPYPSYVRWSAATRTNLEPSMWFRSKNSGNTSYIFDTYNAVSHVGTGLNGINLTDTIPPLQAFWVRVSSGNQTGTLSFDNSMRCHRGVNVNKLKAPEFGNDDQKLLRLQVSNGTNRDETILLFNPNAKDEYDIYDSPKMTNANNEVPEIYTQLNNEQLVINGLSKCVENQQYVLGFKTGSRNEFIIKATELKNFESNTNVYLIDNVNNTETEITAGQEYKFVSDPVNSVSRFGLVFRSGSVNTGLINNNREISVFLNQDKNITVLCHDFYKDKASLVLYNLEGNVVNKTDIIASKTILKTTYPTGIYIAKLYTSNKVETFKLVLNN